MSTRGPGPPPRRKRAPRKREPARGSRERGAAQELGTELPTPAEPSPAELVDVGELGLGWQSAAGPGTPHVLVRRMPGAFTVAGNPFPLGGWLALVPPGPFFGITADDFAAYVVTRDEGEPEVVTAALAVAGSEIRA